MRQDVTSFFFLLHPPLRSLFFTKSALAFYVKFFSSILSVECYKKGNRNTALLFLFFGDHGMLHVLKKHYGPISWGDIYSMHDVSIKLLAVVEGPQKLEEEEDDSPRCQPHDGCGAWQRRNARGWNAARKKKYHRRHLTVSLKKKKKTFHKFFLYLNLWGLSAWDHLTWIVAPPPSIFIESLS